MPEKMSDDERPECSYAVQMVLTWFGVVLFFVLCCLFPHQAAWLFSVFRRN